ncbi:MAG: nucleotidyltransferase [Clostridiaceae bacterium]|nr:nucleotidyltransferase [Clostridiaceae bacterium]
MKVLGLVTEYNPFHNGHKYHLDLSKKITGADFTVCVMSGNFIQRGEPALLNKWSRARMALENGVDLVIELPVSYVLQSAEFFAFGAVKILDSLNIVTHLCFGSEWGQIDELKEIAKILIEEPEEISQKYKYYLKEGHSFVKARERAVVDYLKGSVDAQSIGHILSSPNNILGIEYIKALYRLGSSIQPVTLKRHKAGYHSLEAYDNITSATAIRNLLESSHYPDRIKPYMPAASFSILANEIDMGKAPVFTQQFEQVLLTLLRKMSAAQLSNFPDVNEGLENRIKDAVNRFGTYESVISNIKTKRYTRTRLQRIMFNVLLGITKDLLNTFQKYGGPQYIRILGLNSKGRILLKEAAKKASLPIFIKPSLYRKSCNPLLRQMMELDFLSTDLYALHYPNPRERLGNIDITTSPIIME